MSYRLGKEVSRLLDGAVLEVEALHVLLDVLADSVLLTRQELSYHVYRTHVIESASLIVTVLLSSHNSSGLVLEAFEGFGGALLTVSLACLKGMVGLILGHAV